MYFPVENENKFTFAFSFSFINIFEWMDGSEAKKRDILCLCWNLSIPVGLIWASRPTRWSLWYIRYMTEKYCTARLIWARLTFEGHLCRGRGWDLERGISRGGRLPLGAVWPTDFTKDPSKIEPRMQCRLSRTFLARNLKTDVVWIFHFILSHLLPPLIHGIIYLPDRV